MLDKKYGAPLITNDGVTIAKEIELDDPFENMGAQLVKEVSTKTNDVAGDGTTTATLLAQAIIHEGLKNLAAGANPIVMKKGMAKAVEAAVAEVQEAGQKVDGTDDIARVGAVSSGDETIGKLIAEAMEKVGHDGVITIEESKTAETYSEVVEGMQFDRGYITPYMATDMEKMEAVLDDAYILITDKKISVIADILPMLEQMVQSGKKLMIIAEDVEGEALSTLIVNRLRGTLNVVLRQGPRLRRPPQGDAAGYRHPHRRHRSSARSWAMELKSATIDMLGRARQVKVTKENTAIVDGAGDSQAIKDRVAQIRSQIANTTSDYDKEKLQERLAKLAGGVAVIKVGAATETEMKEKKLRIEDALNATQRRCGRGRGGRRRRSHLVNAIPAVEALLSSVEGDEKTGVRIVAKALEAPIRQIAANAGLDGTVILEKVQHLRQDRLRLRRLQGGVLRHGLRRHRRPRQGDPQRPGERRQRGRHGADHRVPGGRQARAPRSARRQPRHGRRHVLSRKRTSAPQLFSCGAFLVGARASHGVPAAPRAVGKGAARERAQFSPQAETELNGLCGDAAPRSRCPRRRRHGRHVLSPKRISSPTAQCRGAFPRIKRAPRRFCRRGAPLFSRTGTGVPAPAGRGGSSGRTPVPGSSASHPSAGRKETMCQVSPSSSRSVSTMVRSPVS